MEREDVEYMCEIAFCIGLAGNGLKDDMSKILNEEMNKREYDFFDYDNYIDFYKYILDKAINADGHGSILDGIYEITDSNTNTLEVRKEFLSTYKINEVQRHS